MTSFVNLPRPPADIAEDLFLAAVFGDGDDLPKGGASPKNRRWKPPGNSPEQLWLVLAALVGEGEAEVGGKTVLLRQGELLLAPCGGVCLTGGLTCTGALLGGALAARYLAAGEGKHMLAARSPVAGTLRRLYASALLGAGENGCWGSAKAFALLMELRAEPKQEPEPLPELVEQARELIRTRFAYLSGIEELADRLGVSKHHLIREFSAHMGLPPGKYLTQTRLENAKLLLQSGRYPLEIVADMVGFAGANYFCKVFKKAAGMTPTEYAQSTAPRRTVGEVEKLEQIFYL